MQLALVSPYPPREDGIAQFCHDLVNGLQKLPSFTINIYALDNGKQNYLYSSPVVANYDMSNRLAYQKMAEDINHTSASLCILQHEFNLFSGNDSEYVFEFLKTLKKPVIIILHTIPINPANAHHQVRVNHIRKLDTYTKHFITMSNHGKEGLQQIGIAQEKITVITHGAPDMPALSQAHDLKKKYHLDNKFVVMTFGIFRPSKGIEYLVFALNKAQNQIPNLKGLIIGKQDENDKTDYFSNVKHLAESRNLSSRLSFIEEFMPNEVLYEYIVASDVIVTPYVRDDKISSGVITFAARAGIPVVTTPYLFAKDLLKEKGIYVPFKDSNTLAEELVSLALNKKKYAMSQKDMITIGNTLSWTEKAKEYALLFNRLIS
jgi:glycosyltransferase involved in cell wall biosynthesis